MSNWSTYFKKALKTKIPSKKSKDPSKYKFNDSPDSISNLNPEKESARPTEKTENIISINQLQRPSNYSKNSFEDAILIKKYDTSNRTSSSYNRDSVFSKESITKKLFQSKNIDEKIENIIHKVILSERILKNYDGENIKFGLKSSEESNRELRNSLSGYLNFIYEDVNLLKKEILLMKEGVLELAVKFDEKNLDFMKLKRQYNSLIERDFNVIFIFNFRICL